MQLKIELYNRLRRALASLFFRRQDAESIAIALQLDLSVIDFDNKAINTFTSIVAMAEYEGKIGLLLQEALLKKPNNIEVLALAEEIAKDGYIQIDRLNIQYAKYQKDRPVDIVLVYEPPMITELKSLRNHMSIYTKNEWMKLYDWMETEKEITCQVALMLLTSELLGSDRPYLSWVPKAREKGMRVVPLLIRPCDWERIQAFAGRIPLPRNEKFVSDRQAWPTVDSAWRSIAEEVLQITKNIRK